MGEVVRQVLIDMVEEGLMFAGRDHSNIFRRGRFYTKVGGGGARGTLLFNLQSSLVGNATISLWWAKKDKSCPPKKKSLKYVFKVIASCILVKKVFSLPTYNHHIKVFVFENKTDQFILYPNLLSTSRRSSRTRWATSPGAAPPSPTSGWVTT